MENDFEKELFLEIKKIKRLISILSEDNIEKYNKTYINIQSKESEIKRNINLKNKVEEAIAREELLVILSDFQQQTEPYISFYDFKNGLRQINQVELTKEELEDKLKDLEDQYKKIIEEKNKVISLSDEREKRR